MFFVLIVFQIASMSFNYGKNIKISYDGYSVQIKYAADVLQKTLLEQGYTIVKDKPDFTIILEIDKQKLTSESFEIQLSYSNIKIKGGDEKGIIYGCNSLSEDLRNKIPLGKIKAKSEAPKLPFRAIKFDLPWDT